MKTIKTLFFTLIALLSIQMAQAQCTGSLSVTGTDPTFTFTTTNPNVASATYLWDFGDGTSTSIPLSVSHTYSFNGTFAAICYYTDSLNMCSDIDTIMITVSSSSSSCNAFFTVSGTGNTYSYAPTSIQTGDSLSWNFGDLSPLDTTNSPTHTYMYNGTYWINLSVYNGTCWDTTSTYVVVTNAATASCDASFTATNSGNTYNFSITNPLAGYNSYYWQYGDGTANYWDPTQTHTYSSPGTYVVTCTQNLWFNSCTDIDTMVITITSTNCSAAFNIGGNGPMFFFTPTNTPNSPIGYYNFEWNFGDGSATQYTADMNSIQHTYTANGTYSVQCILFDSIFCSDTVNMSVVVTNAGSAICDASFITTPNGSGNTYSFTPLSPTAGSSYNWQINSSTFSTQQNATYTFNSPGTYIICLWISDSTALGTCSDISCDTVIISSAACDASFSVIDSFGVYYFFPTSPFSGATYAWDFGDGNTSTQIYPIHQYSPSGTGTYTACLIISDSVGGCSDTTCTTITVGTSPGCDGSFSFSVNGFTASFTASYPTVGASYSWIFGDGTTSTQQNPIHLYPVSSGPATYTVCLTITDSANSCTNTVCSTIVVTSPLVDISGFVIMGSSYADLGVVFLIEYDSTAGTLTAVDTTFIDSMGSYVFTNVSTGNYLIKAALAPNSTGYTNYLPTYYALGTPQIPSGELLWSNADYATSPTNNYYPIVLVTGTNPGGAGFVGGLVSQGANKVGDPISDILIIVTDMSGNPVAYEYSDNTGSFTIGNLPYGDYVLYPEVYGKTTNSMNFTLSSSNNNADNFKVEVNSTSVDVSITTGINSVQEFSNVVLYPNPVKNELNIDFGSTLTSNVTIEMFDVAGRRVSVQNIGRTNLIKINTSELNGGVYFIKMSSNAGEQVFKFVK